MTTAVRRRKPAEPRTYIVVRADLKDAVFATLTEAKDWLRASGMPGTIRIAGNADVVTESRPEVTHWCAGCDGLVSSAVMAWTETGLWRCDGCRGTNGGD